MLEVLVSLALALCTGTITAWRVAHADQFDLNHLFSLIDLPLPWVNQVSPWRRSRGDARLATVQVVLRLILLVISIATFGWLLGLSLVLASFLTGAMIGARFSQPVLQVGPSLERTASIVRAYAQEVRATGNGDRARAADDSAAHIDFLRGIYGELAASAFADLQMPFDAALLLESYFLPESLVDERSELSPDERRDSPPRSCGDLDLGFENWLSSEIHPLLKDPYEQRRVDHLERVRQEILAGGGTAYRGLTRIQQIVAELRQAT